MKSDYFHYCFLNLFFSGEIVYNWLNAGKLSDGCVNSNVVYAQVPAQSKFFNFYLNSGHFIVFYYSLLMLFCNLILMLENYFRKIWCLQRSPQLLQGQLY